MSDPVSGEPIGYMARTRSYYRALGYTRDYEWATHDDVPFTRLQHPLSSVRLALVTTAVPRHALDREQRGRRLVWAGSTDAAPQGLHTDHVAWDKDSTHTDDQECYLPLVTAAQLAQHRLFAGLTSQFISVPTEFSQRKTVEVDAPEVLNIARSDGADAALLTAL